MGMNFRRMTSASATSTTDPSRRQTASVLAPASLTATRWSRPTTSLYGWSGSPSIRNRMESFSPRRGWRSGSDRGREESLLAAALLARCEGALRGTSRSVGVLDEEGFVDLDEVLPLSRNVVTRVDGVDGAGGKAGIAVHTLFGVDVEHVFTLVDAVDRAFVNSGTVLHSDARLADHIGHPSFPPSRGPTFPLALYSWVAYSSPASGGECQRNRDRPRRSGHRMGPKRHDRLEGHPQNQHR